MVAQATPVDWSGTVPAVNWLEGRGRDGRLAIVDADLGIQVGRGRRAGERNARRLVGLGLRRRQVERLARRPLQRRLVRPALRRLRVRSLRQQQQRRRDDRQAQHSCNIHHCIPTAIGFLAGTQASTLGILLTVRTLSQ
jgi:hypothetical protein